MTEAEWRNATDPEPMLHWLQSTSKFSVRKACLFACGCVRRASDLLAVEGCRRAVEVAERFAEGLATWEELDAARQEAYTLHAGGQNVAAYDPVHREVLRKPLAVEIVGAMLERAGLPPPVEQGGWNRSRPRTLRRWRRSAASWSPCWTGSRGTTAGRWPCSWRRSSGTRAGRADLKGKARAGQPPYGRGPACR
jgi:hypothetical protein